MAAVTPLPEPPVRLRLSTPADLVEAVPYLLGFHPRESLVAVSVRGPRHRLGLHLRLDLPPPGGAETEVAQLVSAHLAHDGAEQAMLLVYTDECGPAGPRVRRPLLGGMRSSLAAAGIDLRDALLVSQGRWWSYLCTDTTCCSSEGTPLRPASGSSSAVAATAAYAGLAALPSRADLAASLRPVGPVGSVAWVATEQCLDRAAAQLADRLSGGATRESLRAEHRALLQGAIERCAAAAAMPTDDECARLVLALIEVPFRDEVVGWALGDQDEALRQLLVHLVRRAVPPEDAAVATVLAAVAYQQGDGTFAGMALERALASDPDYRLAGILAETLRRGVPPSAIRSSTRRASRAVAATRHRRRMSRRQGGG